MSGESPFPADETLREFLRLRILPILAVDRGRVELAHSDEAAASVVLRYGAGCAGCPGLGVTHSSIVEPLLRREFPAVVVVDALIEGERVGAAS